MTRADLWYASERSLITESEWDAFVRAGQPELFIELPGEPPDHPQTEEIFLGDPAGASVWWSNGQVTFKGLRDDNDLAALIRLADRLNARVQGDDGEFYE